ncbi:MAG: hypothetical protein LZF60_370026 [Nitrospira sp.]|nr:MAG: hypothetical protein LZF60_370026 [Nitrospira sp.]
MEHSPGRPPRIRTDRQAQIETGGHLPFQATLSGSGSDYREKRARRYESADFWGNP